MTVMEYINAHREDMEPCECVILPDGSVEEPQPSHIKKLEEISGEDKLTLNSRMEKNMEPIFFMVEYTGCMEHPCCGAFPSHSGTGRDTGEPVFCGDACSGLSQGTGRTDLRGMREKSKRTALERH